MNSKRVGYAVVGLLVLSAVGVGAYGYLSSLSDCPATVSADPVGNETTRADGTVVEFEDLPAGQQREFERALERGHAEIGSQSDWEHDWIVHYRDAYYSITIGIC